MIQKLGQARWLWAVLVGLAWALAYPEPRWSVFAWSVPGCLLVVVAGREGWRLFGLAFLAALVFRLVSLRFLLNIPHTGGAIGGWLALSVSAALFSAAWVWLCGVWFRCGLADQNWPWIKRFCFGLFAAAVWVGIEMIQARALGGYPWNFLGVTQFENNPLIQVAAFTGVYGVSFLIVWFSVSVVFAVLATRRATANPWAWMSDMAAPCIVLVCVCLFGYLRLDVLVKVSESIRVAVVQPSIPQRLIWESGNKEERLDKVLELSELALVSMPDVLIWPESSAPVTQENWPRVRHMLQEANTPLILGIDDAERDADTGEVRYYNSAAFVPADDSAPEVYRKRRLVMFGEYIPFEKALPFMKYLSPIGASFSAGTEPVQFPVKNLKMTMAPVICYEDAFPHGVREHVLPGTKLLVNLTNDGWFGEGPAQWQHAANAVFRCIENRVPMVRSCNNGLSCWVNMFGQVRRFYGEESGDIYGAGFAVFEIPLGQALGRSFYNRNGDVFGWSCLVLGLAGVIARQAKRRLHTRREIGYNLCRDSVAMIPKEILKKIRQIELRTKRLVTETLAGQYHSAFKGQGLHFEEVREYFPGDEIRSIDWNVTARMNQPFVKVYSEERELTLMLLVDLSGSGFFGSGEQTKREVAAELASVLAFSAIRNNDKVGLILFTDKVEKYVPPRKGRFHVLRVIREILFYEPENRGTDLNGALEFLGRVVPRKAITVCVSDFLGQTNPTRRLMDAHLRRQVVLSETLAQTSATALRQANRRHDVVAVQVTDPRELELPNVGWVVLQDAETGQIVEINTGDARRREAYSQRQANAQEELVKLFRVSGIDSIQLRTDQPYATALEHFFEMRMKRRHLAA